MLTARLRRARAAAQHRRRHCRPSRGISTLRGLRTLAVRLDRAEQNATELAQRLVGHPRVTRVHYPGLPEHRGYEIAKAQSRGPGAVLSFEIDGTGEEAEAVCNRTRLIVHATSLGGVETLIERRSRYASEVKAGTPTTCCGQRRHRERRRPLGTTSNRRSAMTDLTRAAVADAFAGTHRRSFRSPRGTPFPPRRANAWSR